MGLHIPPQGNPAGASGGGTSTAWAGITGKPGTFTPSAHQHSAGDITSGTVSPARLGTGTTDGTTALFSDGAWKVIPAASWADVTGKPTTYPPSTHGHAASEVTSGAYASRIRHHGCHHGLVRRRNMEDRPNGRR